MNLFDLHCDTAGECFNRKIPLYDGVLHYNIRKGNTLDKECRLFAIWIPDELRGRAAAEYFEKVLFFIKPEYSAVSEGDLRERASIIAQSVGIPPAARLRKSRIRLALSMSAAACAGAVVSGTIFLLTSFF